VLVTVDKFSKWIEAQPITIVYSEKVVAFFTNIIYLPTSGIALVQALSTYAPAAMVQRPASVTQAHRLSSDLFQKQSGNRPKRFLPNNYH
jgi:hypothetical protein